MRYWLSWRPTRPCWATSCRRWRSGAWTVPSCRWPCAAASWCGREWWTASTGWTVSGCWTITRPTCRWCPSATTCSWASTWRRWRARWGRGRGDAWSSCASGAWLSRRRRCSSAPSARRWSSLRREPGQLVEVGVPHLANALRQLQRRQAVSRLLRQPAGPAAKGSHVGGGEGRGQLGGQQAHQVLGLPQQPPLLHAHQPAPGDHPAAPAPRLARHVPPVLLLLDERHLDLQVGVREQLGAVDQLREELFHAGRAGRAAPLLAAIVVVFDQPAGGSHGQHQPDAVLGQQSCQLGAHRAEVACLHLDEQIAMQGVDDVAAQLDLEATAGRRRRHLERRVQLRLVEGADDAHARPAPECALEPRVVRHEPSRRQAAPRSWCILMAWTQLQAEQRSLASWARSWPRDKPARCGRCASARSG